MEYNTKAFLKSETRPSWWGWLGAIAIVYILAFGLFTTHKIYRQTPSFALVVGIFFLLCLAVLVIEIESLSTTARAMDKEAGDLLRDLNRLQLAYWALEKEQVENQGYKSP